jgi:putative transposase
VQSFGLSTRRACNLVDLWRASFSYQRKTADDEAIRLRLKELAEQRRRFGCHRLHVILKREGLVINHKRTERIYREEGLSLRLKKRKKKVAMIRVRLPEPESINQRWSMDFVSDSLCTGRRYRAFNIVDDFSRECLAIEADTSIGGARVVNVLERLPELRGLPEVITLDNGPEFTGKALDEWAYRTGVKLNFIRLGKPVENAYIESFNGKLRDECLNQNWFVTLKDVREATEGWRIDYNEFRPHRWRFKPITIRSQNRETFTMQWTITWGKVSSSYIILININNTITLPQKLFTHVIFC